MAVLLRCICLLCALLSVSRATEGEAQFLPVEIPGSEARILALTGIQEYRCSYRLPHAVQGTLLIAEWYRSGKLIGRYRLSRAKYDPTHERPEGAISLGWQKRDQRLISVQETGDFGQLWSASVLLSGFDPAGAFYFTSSRPEAREGKSGEVRLYPVMGLFGPSRSQVRWPEGAATTADFLSACKAAGIAEAIVLYLYESPFDEEPALPFFAAEEG